MGMKRILMKGTERELKTHTGVCEIKGGCNDGKQYKHFVLFGIQDDRIDLIQQSTIPDLITCREYFDEIIRSRLEILEGLDL